MDDVHIYDLSDDEVEEEHARLPVVIVIALLVLATFLGAIWLAYNQGVARGRATAQVVLNVPAEAPSSNLAQIAAPGMVLNVAPPDEPVAANAPTNKPEPRIQASATPAASLAATPRAPTAAPAPPLPGPAATSPAVVVSQAPAASAPAAAPEILAQPAIANATEGAVLLQIGAYKSEEMANTAWTSFRSQFSDIASPLSENIQKVDLGARGTWYRLRIGPFADKSTAASVCEKLRVAGGTCLIATR